MPFREAIGNNAEQWAQANGIKVQSIRNRDVRKEDVVAQILEQPGESPGLVAILSALEVCPSFEARYDKTTGRTSLRPDRGKCLHFYFYFIDEDMGLCFIRVPTWSPFGVLQTSSPTVGSGRRATARNVTRVTKQYYRRRP